MQLILIEPGLVAPGTEGVDGTMNSECAVAIDPDERRPILFSEFWGDLEIRDQQGLRVPIEGHSGLGKRAVVVSGEAPGRNQAQHHQPAE